MAVYHAARPRPGFGLPGIWSAPRPPAERRHAARAAVGPTARAAGRARGRRPAASRVRHGPSRVGIVLTAIVFVFAVAFLSLSQSVRVAATTYDIIRLGGEQDRLEALRQDARSDVDRLRSAPAIRKSALELGFAQLGTPLVIPAR